MNRPQKYGRKAPVFAGTILALASCAWGNLSPMRALPGTASRFLCYMEKMETSGQQLTLWDRITYSLVLSGPNPQARPTPPPHVQQARL